MKIFVSGSLAYDRIMDFPGRFSDHIMPDKLHMINISFAVNGIVERPGGTAGNIAYALRLLAKTRQSSPPSAATAKATFNGWTTRASTAVPSTSSRKKPPPAPTS